MIYSTVSFYLKKKIVIIVVFLLRPMKNVGRKSCKRRLMREGGREREEQQGPGCAVGTPGPVITTCHFTIYNAWGWGARKETERVPLASRASPTVVS